MAVMTDEARIHGLRARRADLIKVVLGVIVVGIVGNVVSLALFGVVVWQSLYNLSLLVVSAVGFVLALRLNRRKASALTWSAWIGLASVVAMAVLDVHESAQVLWVLPYAAIVYTYRAKRRQARVYDLAVAGVLVAFAVVTWPDRGLPHVGGAVAATVTAILAKA